MAKFPTMADTTLRLAIASDCPALAELGEATFCETFLEEFGIKYPANDLKTFLEKNHTKEAFAAKVSDASQVIWIVEQNHRAIAYANCGPCYLPHNDASPAQGELYRLYIRRSAQGKGLGRHLLETAIGWLEMHYPGPLWLGVWSGNVKAQALYRAYGFEKVGNYEFRVGESRDDEFILCRK